MRRLCGQTLQLFRNIRTNTTIYSDMFLPFRYRRLKCIFEFSDIFRIVISLFNNPANSTCPISPHGYVTEPLILVHSAGLSTAQNRIPNSTNALKVRGLHILTFLSVTSILRSQRHYLFPTKEL